MKKPAGKANNRSSDLNELVSTLRAEDHAQNSLPVDEFQDIISGVLNRSINEEMPSLPRRLLMVDDVPILATPTYEMEESCRNAILFDHGKKRVITTKGNQVEIQLRHSFDNAADYYKVGKGKRICFPKKEEVGPVKTKIISDTVSRENSQFVRMLSVAARKFGLYLSRREIQKEGLDLIGAVGKAFKYVEDFDLLPNAVLCNPDDFPVISMFCKKDVYGVWWFEVGKDSLRVLLHQGKEVPAGTLFVTPEPDYVGVFVTMNIGDLDPECRARGIWNGMGIVHPHHAAEVQIKGMKE